MSQAPPNHNYNTVVVNHQSHRGSFVDSSGFIVDDTNSRQGGVSLENGVKNPQNVTTSPIVGRYRLKHV